MYKAGAALMPLNSKDGEVPVALNVTAPVVALTLTPK